MTSDPISERVDAATYNGEDERGGEQMGMGWGWGWGEAMSIPLACFHRIILMQAAAIQVGNGNFAVTRCDNASKH